MINSGFWFVVWALVSKRITITGLWERAWGKFWGFCMCSSILFFPFRSLKILLFSPPLWDRLSWNLLCSSGRLQRPASASLESGVYRWEPPRPTCCCLFISSCTCWEVWRRVKCFKKSFSFPFDHCRIFSILVSEISLVPWCVQERYLLQ